MSIFKGLSRASASQAVDQHYYLITSLTSVHKEPVAQIDWQEISDKQAPARPEASNRLEQEATARLNRYRPTLPDRLFGTTAGKTARLEKAVEAAREKDDSELEKAMATYSLDREEWEKMHRLAVGILNKDPAAYNEAMVRFNPFTETAPSDAQPRFLFDPDAVQVEFYAHSEEIIPKFSVSLTSDGKLSKKEMAIFKFHELYQNHICSYLLRTARQVLALLPVDFVLIHVLTGLADPEKDKIEQKPILSAAIYSQTLAKLNFDLIDPSDAIKNFKHNMQFSKAAGFKPVEKLDWTSLTRKAR